MKLIVARSLWGMTGSLEEQFARIAGAGYDAVEGHPDAAQLPAFRRLLAKHRLKLIGMAFTGGPDHVASLAAQVKHLKRLNPLSITVHGGKDDFTPSEAVRFYRAAAVVEREQGVPLAHETHRGRILFTPWATGAVLRAVPEIRLCADFSHWCCVTESLLEWHPPADLDLAITRTLHIHARVGYAEGPQVPDPRAPEWADALAKHEAWWKRMVAARKKAGAKFATVTPEFGPPDYLHTLPYTRQPVADLWEVCLWMAGRFRKSFGR